MKRTIRLLWNWSLLFCTWAAVPIGLAKAIEPGTLLDWSGCPLGFLTAAVSSLGFFPLFAFLMTSAESRGEFPESAGEVPWSAALRGGAEECLHRGLLLPAVGLGPQAALFALAHVTDYADPGLKVARVLQCLLRGLAYGALAEHYGFFTVAVGVLTYDLGAFVAVAVLFRSPVPIRR